jgi:hypothetical protein
LSAGVYAWLALLVLVVGAVVVVVRHRRRFEVYRGVEHPQGALELLLLGDGRFVMTLALWDPVVGAMVGEKSLAGEWRRTGDILELRSESRHIVYHRSGGTDAVWIWRQSDLPTFADGIALARRHARAMKGPSA